MNQTTKQRRAELLFERFLKRGASEEINIDITALEETLKRYEKAKKGEILFESSIFEPCLKIVSHDLHHGVFNCFKFEKPFMELMERKKKEMSSEEFEAAFTSKDGKKRTKEENDEELDTDSSDLSTSIEDIDLFQLLTVRIMFLQKDIDKAMAGTGISANAYIFNKMIMDMMKPFVGVKLSDLKPTEKKKLNLFGKTKKDAAKEYANIRKFSITDGVEWIQKYFKLGDTKNAKLIFALLHKNDVFEPIGIVEGYDTSDLMKFNIKKTVVVVGCGAAGITVASMLKKHLNVIVIDKIEDVTFINRFYTLIPNPQAIEELEFPIQSMVKGCKIIKAAVQQISPSAVYLENDTIPYDYLVVASGSHYYVPYEVIKKPFTPKYPRYKFDDVKDQLYDDSSIQIVIPYKKESVIANFQKIRKAKKIIIVGSGSVACESAGELAAKYPNTKIVMITQDSRVLKKYKDKKITAATMKIFKSYGNIEVITKRVITRVIGKRVFYKKLVDDVSVKIVEESMEADVLFNAMGLRPNTKMFKQFMGDSLNAKGAVQVNDYFQVQFGKFFRDAEIDDDFFLKNNDDEETLGDETDDEMFTNDEVTDHNQVAKILEAMNIDTFTLNTQFDSEKIEHGYENIYAVGDIVDTKEEKLTFFAGQHGQRAAQNILISEQCSTVEEFKKRAIRYKGGGTIIQTISLGPTKGVVIKGHKFITHGNVAKYKVEFIGKQLAGLVKIYESEK